jgi:hypothetical protein
MRFLKIIVISLISAFVLVGITNQFTASRYPSCDLVSKGTDVSTYGCSNTPTNNKPCLNLGARSAAQANCINDNYYKYKTFPFGFKQKFGSRSNLNDPKPRQKNELTTFVLGFVLSGAILSSLPLRNKSEAPKSSVTET